MLTLWNYAEAWTPHQVRGDGLWLGKFCFSLLTLRHSGLRPGVSGEVPVSSAAFAGTEIPGQARNDGVGRDDLAGPFGHWKSLVTTSF